MSESIGLIVRETLAGASTTNTNAYSTLQTFKSTSISTINIKHF